MTYESLVFRRDAQGSISLWRPEWPDEIEMAAAVLLEPCREFVDAGEDGYIAFSVQNGCAFYQVVRGHPSEVDGIVLTCRLVTGYVGSDP